MSDPGIFGDLVVDIVHIPVARAMAALAMPDHVAVERLHLCVVTTLAGRVVIGKAVAPKPKKPTKRNPDPIEDTQAVLDAAKADALRQLQA